MRKDLLIALMQKDLDELRQMLDGVGELEHLPEAIGALAVAKANNIVSAIEDLRSGNYDVEPSVQQAEAPAVELEEVRPEPKEEAPIVEEVQVEEHEEVHEEQTPEPIVEKEAPMEEKPLTIGEALNVEPSLNEQLQHEDVTIGGTIGMQKVADLASCMSLGESFRFQRELFANNGERMMQAISDLNGMSNIDEAMAYIERFGWDKEVEVVKSFIALLQRRF